jgi:MSHA biogenesis protein MshQ
MRYYDSGFDFNVPTQTSCKESGDISVSAIGRDPATGQCVPLFASRTENVSFWSTYINPNIGAEAVRINGTSVSGVSPGVPIALTFDANGQSTFKFAYNDAGQIELNARYIGAGGETGLEMLGNDSFVVAPAGLCVYSDAANSDCASGDADCSVFVAAGDPFALKVKGVCWQADGETNAQFCDNATITNFRMSNIALSHSLVAPATGVPGSIALSSADIIATGEVAVQQSVSEVGVFTFSADPPNDYLGAGDVFAGATFTSANIGRFIPHHFSVSISPDPPVFADSCVGSAFTYLGQPFNWAATPQMTIRAMNADNGKTENYEGLFWKLADPLASYAYVDAGAPAAVLPLTPATSSQSLPATSDCNGEVTIALTESGFNYTRPGMAAPVSPFVPDVSFSVTQARLTDTDSVCYDLGAGAGCQGFERAGITGAHLRHGQVRVMNNFGPETADITRSPFEVQYYNGSGWVVSVDDNCTTGLAFCPSARVSAIQPVPLFLGKGTLTVTRPDSVTVCPIAPAWLTALTDCGLPDGSCGEFTFGIYRGNDRIINWQEITQ